MLIISWAANSTNTQEKTVGSWTVAEDVIANPN